MKSVVVEFDEKEAFEKANTYFVKICGFKEENQKHKKMLSVGMECRSQGIGGIRIRAVISSYPSVAFRENKVIIDTNELECPAFQRIDPNYVKRIYAYMLTVGECSYSDEDDITRQVFSDIWGTAYTDSARDLLEEYIKKELEQDFPGQLGKSLFLSDAFGPGFYGMDVVLSRDLYRILDADRIGVQVKDSGILLPLKSCSGVYLVVEKAENLPRPDCRECIGNSMGCSFCRFRQEQE